MLHNFLITAVRNFLRAQVYSIINVLGLAVGLTGCILILLWVVDEFRYDRFHADKERIYQVLVNEIEPDGTRTHEWTPGPLADALRQEIPEIEAVCRSSWYEQILVANGQNSRYCLGYSVDPSFLNVFSFPLTQGDPANVFPDINSIALSESTARSLFKDQNALGQVVRIGDSTEAKVTAVLKDAPKTSTFQFRFLRPMESYIRADAETKDFKFNTLQTYVKLRAVESKTDVEAKLKNFLSRKRAEGPRSELTLFALVDWRLHTDFDSWKQDSGRMVYVMSFSALAVFALALACINFMNLATARAMRRAREVGVRKVAGASRSAIVQQFIIESLFLSGLAMVIAILFALLCLPLFNNLCEKNLQLDFSDPLILSGLLCVTVLTGIVAGGYPAFFLSSFRPALVLKGNLISARGGARLRKALVVFQFALSVVLIVIAIGINSQIQYILNKDVGFERKNIIGIEREAGGLSNYEAFRNELLRSPKIMHVSRGDNPPMNFNGDGDEANFDEKPANNKVVFHGMECDSAYIPTFGLTLVEGRNFLGKNDSANFIVSEEAVRQMGFTRAVGQRLKFKGREGQIIGVVRDFHSQSFHEAIQPIVFLLNTQGFGDIFVRYIPGPDNGAMDYIEATYKKIEPRYPLLYRYVEDRYSWRYHSEIVLGDLSICFTAIAIFISCLGLFGLTLFTTERRIKEIGIRKVLGASVSQITVLLCADFVRPVALAIILGCSVGYYLMQEFLSTYVYHFDVTIWLFLFTAMAVAGIGLLTVIFQSSKAAGGNPVEALKNE